jgi:AraC family transcriptional regulator
MASTLRRFLPLLSRLNASSDATAAPLTEVARRVGLSPFHFQRSFLRAVGESPKQYLLRRRLERAAAALLRDEASVLDVALDAGFDSHEGFTRAFHRHFGRSPREYRARTPLEPVTARAHAARTARYGPCVGLFGVTLSTEGVTPMPSYEIRRENLPTQHALVIRRRVARAQIAASLGDLFGKVFGHIQRSGLPLAGAPFARYSEWSAAHVTMEAGFPLAKSAASEGDITAVTFGGPVARTVHQGPYDGLGAAHQALEEWIVAQGATPGPMTWEAYVTDPGTVPNPADWKTEVYRSIAP